jgi:hypothetical protein
MRPVTPVAGRIHIAARCATKPAALRSCQDTNADARRSVHPDREIQASVRGRPPPWAGLVPFQPQRLSEPMPCGG